MHGEIIATDLEFPEGPVWLDGTIWFTEILGGLIYPVRPFLDDQPAFVFEDSCGSVSYSTRTSEAAWRASSKLSATTSATGCPL